MGSQRNGARSTLNLLAKACKLSRTPGWRVGITDILGGTDATDFYAVWEPLCAIVDILIAEDNFYNQIDFVEEKAGSEDVPVLL